jgi:hypothetical protein
LEAEAIVLKKLSIWNPTIDPFDDNRGGRFWQRHECEVEDRRQVVLDRKGDDARDVENARVKTWNFIAFQQKVVHVSYLYNPTYAGNLNFLPKKEDYYPDTAVRYSDFVKCYVTNTSHPA